MPTNAHSQLHSNERYQRALADNLVKALGRDNAIDACYDHDWMETLKFVKASESSRTSH